MQSGYNTGQNRAAAGYYQPTGLLFDSIQINATGIAVAAAALIGLMLVIRA
jgi:hypothetical protein